MSSWYFTRRRGEMFLGWLRLGAAFLTTLAVLSGGRLALHAIAEPVSLLYAIGAVLALVVTYLKQPVRQRRVLEQALDGAVSLFFIAIAANETAVVYTHFAYLVAAAAIRFRWATVVATVAACIATYAAALSVEHGFAQALVNVTALAIVGAAASLVTNYQERLRTQLSTVLEPRSVDLEDAEALYDSALSNAAKAMRVPRLVAIVYSGNLSQLCVWTGSELHVQDVHASAWTGAFAEPLEHVDFYCNDLTRDEVVTSTGDVVMLSDPLSDDLVTAHEITSVLRVMLQGTHVSGSLLLLDRAFGWDDFALGRLVADVLATRMDDHELVRSASAKAVAAERSRIARDLHDTLLQSLTGAALQLDGARRLVDERPEDAKQLLREVQDVVVVEQNELRFLIETLRRKSTSRAHELKSEVRFNAVVTMVRRQWGAEVDFNVPSLQMWVGKEERREIHRLIREAVFNAAKHSGAKRISVDGSVESGSLRLVIRNDGRGFPFRGRYDLGALNQMQVGPASLKERIATLGGNLVIESHDFGSEVEIRLPVRSQEGHA